MAGFFSDQANLDTYLGAAAVAWQVFEQALKAAGRHPLPATIQFRPMSRLARVRPRRDGTCIAMPTPMVCFTKDLFEALAGLMIRREPNRQPILEAMAADTCQNIHAELEALGGVVELTAGMTHDLAASFGRVNSQYFQGRMDRPRLTWSRTFTGRKFGHYDPVRDTVMVSATLDRASVPECVVDFIMYHELLHKRHGIGWRSGRARVHTPAFKQQEQRFDQYEEAEAVLKEIAQGNKP